MDWITCTQSFICVVEQGSLAQAATKLHASSSALSKRLSWLESQLGVQLLKRTTRSLSMTDAGDLFYQRAKAWVDDWQQLVSETASTFGEVSGILRIGAPLVTGNRFLVNFIAEFLEIYPKIKVELTTLTPGQLPDLNLDVVISRELDYFNSASYIAAKLFDFQPGFFAAPSYLARHAPITSPTQLTEHNVLLYGNSHQPQERVFEDGTRLQLSGNCVSPNPEALVSAAVIGMGIILGGAGTVQKELDQGLLVPVLPTLKQPRTSAYAYYPKLDYNHTKTKLFIDFIKQKVKNLYI
ncbi:LysR family transcriptional regulator [Salinivibrio sp. IB872]|uniref:LysR family transcriptional regulator n=1 Tax=Salinivibrio sp. IB872 TaxID=1766123 RepID=UPI000987C7BB|nr:LysR family transcriptional regulator [Salinivibrio sp. IB872]OOF26635.1 LysR family transcriptional regulator [Salinivibrio sp. IB872]